MDERWENLPAHWRRNLNVIGKFYTAEGSEQKLQQLIETFHVTDLYVFGGLSAYYRFHPLIEQCEVQGIDINVVMRNRLSSNLRVLLNEVGDTRMMVLSTTPEFSWARACKGVLDRLVAFLILVCSSPVWLIAAIGIKISDPKGPIFFRQRRSGLYGEVFHMWKFRSMYVDAEARLEEIKAKYGNEMNGPIFKLTNDPRIFKFGHFIRKTSIDELPQLLNILTGDMSIVGPRPLPVYETEAFPKIEHRRRLSVKPGLTCYWQIEDRSDNGDFDNMVAKDLRYIDEWSLWLDIKLFFRTIPAVLFGKGAK
jgi:exopolysaccharide biosynthesis polyprenyl glycosylphosphotransferase